MYVCSYMHHLDPFHFICRLHGHYNIWHIMDTCMRFSPAISKSNKFRSQSFCCTTKFGIPKGSQFYLIDNNLPRLGHLPTYPPYFTQEQKSSTRDFMIRTLNKDLLNSWWLPLFLSRILPMTSSWWWYFQDSIRFVHEIILEDETKLKGIPADCSKIMVWHLYMPRVIPLPFHYQNSR